MKKILKIAHAELQAFFYSPIAWLVLIIFTFQVGMNFMDSMGGWIKYFINGYSAPGVSMSVFADPKQGLFYKVLQYLYLYVPLLTMGLMSKEFSSGSIKLLYSSPVTNTQIIMGKFLSMVFFGLILMGILMVFVIYSNIVIANFELQAVLVGLLGIFLLFLAYSAIGLFMSSLTSYQVVAAIGTIVLFAILNYIGYVAQDIAFVRNITYWLSISGRASVFISGLLTSENLLYFIIVISLFLLLTIIRLQTFRQKTLLYVSLSKYLAIISCAVILSFITTRPSLMSFYDATSTKANTLSIQSQEIIKELKGGLTITTYVNAFDLRHIRVAIPRAVNADMERFKQYQRFKPEIKLKYVYYYDTVNSGKVAQDYPDLTWEERLEKIAGLNDVKPKLFSPLSKIKQPENFAAENGRFVRSIERENGEQTYLRIFNDIILHPGEREISAALKRLTKKLPTIGFVVGHGEREIGKSANRDYSQFVYNKTYRGALVNQGFDIKEVSLNGEVPADINILVIADVRDALTDQEIQYINNFIELGGNLLIAVEPNRYRFATPIVENLGISFLPGMLVTSTEEYEPNLTLSRATPEARQVIEDMESLRKRNHVITMPGAAGIEYRKITGFDYTPMLVSEQESWNELHTFNFVDDMAVYNPERGETKKPHITGLAVTRMIDDKEQRIFILSDADCISNGEMGSNRRNIFAGNSLLVNTIFYWLSNDEVPLNINRPLYSDNDISVRKKGLSIAEITFQWIFPGIFILLFIITYFRRKSK